MAFVSKLRKVFRLLARSIPLRGGFGRQGLVEHLGGAGEIPYIVGASSFPRGAVVGNKNGASRAKERRRLASGLTSDLIAQLRKPIDTALEPPRDT